MGAADALDLAGPILVKADLFEIGSRIAFAANDLGIVEPDDFVERVGSHFHDIVEVGLGCRPDGASQGGLAVCPGPGLSLMADADEVTEIGMDVFEFFFATDQLGQSARVQCLETAFR